MADKHIADGESAFLAVNSSPDACQVGDVVVPFDSFQLLSNKKQYSETVWARGFSVLNVGSVIAGTQSNAGKGVISGTSLSSGDCTVLSGSPTVSVEGKAVALHGSMVGMNNMNCQGTLLTKQAPPNMAVKDNAQPCNNPPVSSPRLEELMKSRQEVSNSLLESLRESLDFSKGINSADEWAKEQIDKLRPVPLVSGSGQMIYDMETGAEIPVEIYNAQNEINAGVVRGVLGFGRSMVSGIASLGNMLDQHFLEDPRVKPLDMNILMENIRLGNVCLEGIEKQISDTWGGIKDKTSKAWDDFQNASAGDKAEMATRALAEIATLLLPVSKVGLASKPGAAADVIDTARTTEFVKAADAANDAKTALGTANDLEKTADASKTASSLNKTDDALSEAKNDGLYVEKNGTPIENNQSSSADSTLCSQPGDPVDAGSGDFLQQHSVLSLPGSLPLTLTRFYRSQAKKTGLLGPKWTDEWSSMLTVHGNEMHFTNHEGVDLYYRIPQNGIFRNTVNTRQAYYRLSGDIRDELTIFDRRSQHSQVFSLTDNGTYLLSAIHDRYGNRADFLRTDGLLTGIHHSDGYTLSLVWQQRQLMSIDLVTPQRHRLVTCHYDKNGYLAECDSFQFAHLWHEYTAEGWMTRWRDTDKTCVDIVYDTQGRAVSTLSTEGYFDDRFIYNDEEKCTTYLDGEGGETRYWYNEDGLVTLSIDPLGRAEKTLWNNTRLLSRTDALGRTTEYDYNSEGEISRVSLPGGYSLFYDYNESGQLTRLTTPGDQLWQWEYDDKGSMVCLTDPQGRKQQFSYSEQGDLLAQIMPGGATWRWSHDALHQVREAVAPDGGVTQTGQDFLGRLLSVKDPLGFTTQFRHSKNHAGPRGSVEEISRPDGVRELMRQNSEKLPESFTDGEGKTTRYEYGAFDLLSAVIRPDGQRLECRYDKLTRLTEIINAEGESYRLTYDRAGQLIAETDFTGRTLTYRYDAAGRCIRTTFPDGTHLHRRYNVTNQVTDEDVTQGDSDRILSTTTFRYDTLCRLVEAKNNDATVTYEYDDAGRITAETINGRRTEYRHDPEQDSVSQRTTGEITERFTRGLMGELTSWQIADHAPLTFEHDLRGQETSRRSEAGFYQTLGYTQTGRLTTQRAGSQSEPQARDTDLQRQWLYDKAYNLSMISDSLRGTMVNSMTANDQISHATWTGSGNTQMREERFTYDSNLNISRRQTWVNEVMESEAYQHQQHGRVTSREYKEWRHSTQRINPDTGKPEEGKFVRVVSAHGITWKYDVNGRLVEKLVDKGGYRPLLWRYRWDARSQLTGLETPEGERWEYRYDPFGRRISKRCTNRDKPGMDFHWNGDQLTEEIPVGTDGTPEDVNAIRWIYEPGSFTPLARYEKGQLHYAVTDTVGRIQELLTEDGEIVWRGKQQLWGREESRNKEDAPSCHLRFPGQYEDAESGLYYNRFRYYDCDTGQYLCADPVGLGGGINPYGYVGNPLKYIDLLGLCKEHIETPYGSAYQSNSPEALAAREKVENGATLYRMGTTGRSETTGAQFWALEHPSSPGYAGRYGIPQENIDRSDFIMTAKLKPGSDFITRPAPGIGDNLGGGIEVVAPPDAVDIITFSKH